MQQPTNVKPIIGITTDYGPKPENSSGWFYFLNEPYLKAVLAGGGVPLLLPPVKSATDTYLNLIDGLVLSGGGMHVNPSEYGEKAIDNLPVMHADRFSFESNILKEGAKRDMPILGICGGMQVMNVVYGGSLHQSLGASHMQKKSSKVATHSVSLDESSKLYSILKSTKINTNSHHSQAVNRVAGCFKLTARSGDNIIEGIECCDASFMLGVQWHPETLDMKESHILFAEFMKESIKYKLNIQKTWN